MINIPPFNIGRAGELKAARDKRHDAEKLLEQGQDPVAVREAKRQEDEKLKHTFRLVADEWATAKLEKENKAKSTIKREHWNLVQLNREIGDRPLCEIAPPELLTTLRRVEARGRYYTVGRLRSIASWVFQFGVGASYCSSDPTRDLKHALTKAPKGNPRPALTDPDDVGDLMRRIEVYDAKNGGLVRYALKLIALTMVRPGELRLAEWAEFDEKNSVWLIPAQKMKMGDDHEVPLSRQALAILAELRSLIGRGRYLFSHDDDVPMSDNTINKASRIMGYNTGPRRDRRLHHRLAHDLRFRPQLRFRIHLIECAETELSVRALAGSADPTTLAASRPLFAARSGYCCRWRRQMSCSVPGPNKCDVFLLRDADLN